VGLERRAYILGLGQDEIAKRIGAHFEELLDVFHRVDQLSPGSTSPASKALELERDAKRGRLRELFVPEAEARARYDVASAAETAALTAICEYRCASFD